MGFVTAIAALSVAALGASVYTGIQSAETQNKAAKAQRRQAEIENQRAENVNRQKMIQNLRQMRIARAQSLQSAANAGAIEGSAGMGAVASIGSQGAANIQNLAADRQLAYTSMLYGNQANKYTTTANRLGVYSGLLGQASSLGFSIYGNMSKPQQSTVQPPNLG